MNLDYRLFRLLNGLATRGHVLRSLVRILATDVVFIFPVVLVALWLTSPRTDHRVRKAIVLAMVGTVVALGVNQLLNHLVARPRPYSVHHVHLLLPRSGDRSFPSDHSAVAFAVTAAVWLERKKTGLLLAVAGAAVAVARVICGVHYPGDVAGGAAVGIVSVVVIATLGRRPLDALTRLLEDFYFAACALLRRRLRA